MNDEMMKIAIFQKKEIRKQLHGGEWWFVMADVVVALTDSNDPAQYLKRLRLRDKELAKIMSGSPVEKGAVQFVPPFPILRHPWWQTKAPLLAHRRHLPPHPIHPQQKSRAVQALAGKGGP